MNSKLGDWHPSERLALAYEVKDTDGRALRVRPPRSFAEATARDRGRVSGLGQTVRLVGTTSLISILSA